MKNQGTSPGLIRPYSSPIFQQRKLTLEDFPMEYGIKDVKQRSMKARQERLNLQDRILSARKDSGTLREYGRRRFQSVVDLQTKSCHPPSHTGPKIPPRPKTTEGGILSSQAHLFSPSTTTNGPSKDGSILYNGRPILSCLRSRPNSEPPSRFDHLRRMRNNYPDIQRILEQSNYDYRVGASTCQEARTERFSSSDLVLLISATSPSSSVLSGATVEEKQGQAWLEDLPLLASTARSQSPRSEGSYKLRDTSGSPRSDDGLKNWNSKKETCSSGSPNSNLSVPVATTTSELRIFSQSSEITTDKTPARPLSAASLTRQFPFTAAANDPVSRSGSARSNASSVDSSVTFSPRPYCWVDDVTVSSDGSLTERDLSVLHDLDDKTSLHSQELGQRGQKLGLFAQAHRVSSPPGDKKRAMQPTKRVSSSLLKRSPGAGKLKQVSGCPRSLKQSTTSGSKGEGVKSIAKVGEESQAIYCERAECVEIVLPRFLCPSSETKSRQAAIKEWLANTSFNAACRTLPLM